MFGLAVYDLVADEDLVRGRTIAGTGTLAGDGTVGRVGSVREKVLAAVDAGVTVMLVPHELRHEAEDAAAGRLEVVGVGTFAEALAALR